VGSFKATLGLCVGTIVVVDLPRCNPASQRWCLYEWDKTITLLGLEALHFVEVSEYDLNKIVGGVSVVTAKCTLEQDIELIQKEVKENPDSLRAFDDALKLVLLFAPTSYKLDLEQLHLRSKDTSWKFDAVRLGSRILRAPCPVHHRYHLHGQVQRERCAAARGAGPPHCWAAWGVDGFTDSFPLPEAQGSKAARAHIHPQEPRVPA
jgi:hypothetical protein